MMYNYQGLEALLKQAGLNKSDLTKTLNISSRNIAKIAKGEKIVASVINKLCIFLIAQKTVSSL